MGVRTDVAQIRPQQLVELFQFDLTPLGGTLFLWYSGTGRGDEPIVWNGQAYQPLPIEANGFEQGAIGQLPRPTLAISNIGGYVGNLLRSFDDALGVPVIRIRTFGKYLDAINFPTGSNPTADPTQEFPREKWLVSRKVSENPILVEIELCAPLDVAGILLPRRQIIAGTCTWVYRSVECGYTGPPVQDAQGNPTSDPAKDQCRKTLGACKARFGEWGVLPHSGFPASLLSRST